MTNYKLIGMMMVFLIVSMPLTVVGAVGCKLYPQTSAGIQEMISDARSDLSARFESQRVTVTEQQLDDATKELFKTGIGALFREGNLLSNQEIDSILGDDGYLVDNSVEELVAEFQQVRSKSGDERNAYGREKISAAGVQSRSPVNIEAQVSNSFLSSIIGKVTSLKDRIGSSWGSVADFISNPLEVFGGINDLDDIVVAISPLIDSIQTVYDGSKFLEKVIGDLAGKDMTLEQLRDSINEDLKAAEAYDPRLEADSGLSDLERKQLIETKLEQTIDKILLSEGGLYDQGLLKGEVNTQLLKRFLKEVSGLENVDLTTERLNLKLKALTKAYIKEVLADKFRHSKILNPEQLERFGEYALSGQPRQKDYTLRMKYSVDDILVATQYSYLRLKEAFVTGVVRARSLILKSGASSADVIVEVSNDVDSQLGDNNYADKLKGINSKIGELENELKVLSESVDSNAFEQDSLSNDLDTEFRKLKVAKNSLAKLEVKEVSSDEAKSKKQQEAIDLQRARLDAIQSGIDNTVAEFRALSDKEVELFSQFKAIKTQLNEMKQQRDSLIGATNTELEARIEKGREVTEEDKDRIFSDKALDAANILSREADVMDDLELELDKINVVQEAQDISDDTALDSGNLRSDVQKKTETKIAELDALIRAQFETRRIQFAHEFDILEVDLNPVAVSVLADRFENTADLVAELSKYKTSKEQVFVLEKLGVDIISSVKVVREVMSNSNDVVAKLEARKNFDQEMDVLFSLNFIFDSSFKEMGIDLGRLDPTGITLNALVQNFGDPIDFVKGVMSVADKDAKVSFMLSLGLNSEMSQLIADRLHGVLATPVRVEQATDLSDVVEERRQDIQDGFDELGVDVDGATVAILAQKFDSFDSMMLHFSADASQFDIEFELETMGIDASQAGLISIELEEHITQERQKDIAIRQKKETEELFGEALSYAEHGVNERSRHEAIVGRERIARQQSFAKFSQLPVLTRRNLLLSSLAHVAIMCESIQVLEECQKLKQQQAQMFAENGLAKKIVDSSNLVPGDKEALETALEEGVVEGGEVAIADDLKDLVIQHHGHSHEESSSTEVILQAPGQILLASDVVESAEVAIGGPGDESVKSESVVEEAKPNPKLRLENIKKVVELQQTGFIKGDLSVDSAGRMQVLPGSEVVINGVVISDDDVVSVFLDGEKHEGVRDRYISMNLDENKFFAQSVDGKRLELEFEKDNPFFVIEEADTYSMIVDHDGSVAVESRVTDGKIPLVEVSQNDNGLFFIKTGSVAISNFAGQAEVGLSTQDGTSTPMSIMYIENDGRKSKFLISNYNEIAKLPGLGDTEGIVKMDGYAPGKISEDLSFNYNNPDFTIEGFESNHGLDLNFMGALNDQPDANSVKRLHDIVNNMPTKLADGVVGFELYAAEEWSEHTSKVFGIQNSNVAGYTSGDRIVRVPVGNVNMKVVNHEVAHDLNHKINQELEADRSKALYEIASSEGLDEVEVYFTHSTGQVYSYLCEDCIVKINAYDSSGAPEVVSQDVEQRLAETYKTFSQNTFETRWRSVAGDYGVDLGAKIVAGRSASNWEDGTNVARNGFVRAYGANNIMEDIATFMEYTLEEPEFFRPLITEGSVEYDPKYIQKIDLLLEYGFITDRDYEFIVEAEAGT
jgi:hypothetical protein